MRATLATTVLAVLLSYASARAQEVAPPIDIGPVQFEQDVVGIKVRTEVRTHVVLTRENEQVRADIVVEARLGDLQHKFPAIVESFKLPTENCKSYSANNPVVGLHKKDLVAEPGSGLIAISGDASLWDCRENPIPKSKVVWEMKKKLGITQQSEI